MASSKEEINGISKKQAKQNKDTQKSERKMNAQTEFVTKIHINIMWNVSTDVVVNSYKTYIINLLVVIVLHEIHRRINIVKSHKDLKGKKI